MPITEPNNPTGIRKYIDEQIDAVQALFNGSAGDPVALDPTEQIRYERAVMDEETANDAEDMLAFYYDGVRTGYHNEYGEIRGRAAKTSTVAARFQRRSDSSTANILEVTTQGNALLAGFSAAGILVGPGVEPGAWTPLTFVTGTQSGAGYPVAGVSYNPVTRKVTMRGRIDIVSGSFTSNQTIANVPVNFRPLNFPFSEITRTNSAGALLTVNPDGTLTVATAFTGGAGVFAHLDGIEWPLY